MPDYTAIQSATKNKDWQGLQGAIAGLGNDEYLRWANAIGINSDPRYQWSATNFERTPSNQVNWDLAQKITNQLYGAQPPSPPTTTTPQTPMTSYAGGGGWLNQSDQSLGGLLNSANQASANALPGLLSQPTTPGILGGSDWYGTIPWGMNPADTRTLLNSWAVRAMAQKPNKF